MIQQFHICVQTSYHICTLKGHICAKKITQLCQQRTYLCQKGHICANKTIFVGLRCHTLPARPHLMLLQALHCPHIPSHTSGGRESFSPLNPFFFLGKDFGAVLCRKVFVQCLFLLCWHASSSYRVCFHLGQSLYLIRNIHGIQFIFVSPSVLEYKEIPKVRLPQCMPEAKGDVKLMDTFPWMPFLMFRLSHKSTSSMVEPSSQHPMQKLAWVLSQILGACQNRREQIVPVWILVKVL